MQRNKLIAYAMDFSSYLISKLGYIDNIILHGSVARGDFDEESDIDLFIDTKKAGLDVKIKSLLEGYYQTKKFKEWELKGMQNQISLITGNLNADEWKNLKRAIISTGILLYGKYKSNVEKIYQYTLFSFENVKPDKKRVAIFRKLFGFKIGKKAYKGLAEKMSVIRVGKGVILVPAEYVNELKKYFREKRISIRLYDLWSDSKIT